MDLDGADVHRRDGGHRDQRFDVDHVSSQQQHDAHGAGHFERRAIGGGVTGRRLLVALCLLLAAGFAALGVWQVERRAWKLALIGKVEARIHAPPRALPPYPAAASDLAYLRVRTRGVLLNDRETLVQAV